VSGTSFATPLAAAAAALLIQSHPTITRDKVVSALKNTCDKIRANAGIVYDANGHNTRYGHGRINIENALKNAT
jgi:subtilisin family serine protease